MLKKCPKKQKRRNVTCSCQNVIMKTQLEVNRFGSNQNFEYDFQAQSHVRKEEENNSLGNQD